MIEFESCEKCIHDSKGLEEYPCNECIHNAIDHYKPIPKQTNAEKIRSMSDEKLAEFLFNFKNTFGKEHEGKMSCLDWLQKEVEE